MLPLALFLVAGAVNLQLPLYPAYARDAGLGAGGLSAVLAGYVATLVVALVTLAGLPDRLGPRPVVLASLVAACAATVLVIVEPGIVGLGGARWLQGLAVALCMGSATAWMALEHGPARAAVRTSAATALGFGFGGLVTGASQLLDPRQTPWSYPLWAVALALTAAFVARKPSPPADPDAALLRWPAYPAGSLRPGASIALAWTLSGIVVAVLPGVLADLGHEGMGSIALFAMLAAGLAAQPQARRLSPQRSLRFAYVALPIGTAAMAVGVAISSALLLVIGTAVAGAATHGYAYLGGLARVTALQGAPARAVSGYFLLAYAGFGLPAVVAGGAVDLFGAPAAFAGLALLITGGCAALAWSAD